MRDAEKPHVRIEGSVYRFSSMAKYRAFLRKGVETYGRPDVREYAKCIAYEAPEIVDWTTEDFREELEAVRPVKP